MSREVAASYIIGSNRAGRRSVMVLPTPRIAQKEMILMPALQNLQGKKYGRLTVLYRDKSHFGRGDHTYWVCRCDCGRITKVRPDALKSGTVVSCGCYHSEISSDIASKINFKHGLSRSRLFGIWKNIQTRCYNQKSPAFSNYGGRGISMCEEWKNDFLSFFLWSTNNGYEPGLEIDRIDNDGPYAPKNCRWITRKENCRNRRNNYQVEINGVIYQSAAEAAEKLNIFSSSLNNQIKKRGKRLCFIEKGGRKIWSSAS